MFRITITAGTEYQKDGRPVADFPAKLRAIRQHIAATFGGFTEVQTFGGWIGPYGELTMESGRRWDILTDAASNDLAAVQVIAQRLAGLVAVVLNQEAVVAEVQQVAAEFVPQPAANDNLPANAAEVAA